MTLDSAMEFTETEVSDGMIDRISSDSEPVVHLLSPSSLKTWFPWFADLRPGDRVIEIGENDENAENWLNAMSSTFWPTDTIVIHSGHRSLLRDERIANELRRRHVGRIVHQSRRAIEVGIDKLRMKELFVAGGIPTEPYLSPGDMIPAGKRFLMKARNSTEAEGLRFAVPGEIIQSGAYAEPFVEGIEYSVVSYTNNGVTGTFPPVWKGAVSDDLRPPFRRLRTCPCVEISQQTENMFRDLSRRLAALVDCDGLMELELILKPDGSVSVLEINPRVAGTMRLTAMACGVALFADSVRMTTNLNANGFALEFPYNGPHFSRPSERIFATSRLTMAADTLDDIIRRLSAAPDLLGQAYLPQIAKLAGTVTSASA